MKASEIRDMSAQEIQQRIAEEQKELQNKRFQQAVAGLENPVSDIRERRRRIARLKTLLREKSERLKRVPRRPADPHTP
jgi:large subunit ribosomal protein L29